MRGKRDSLEWDFTPLWEAFAAEGRVDGSLAQVLALRTIVENTLITDERSKKSRRLRSSEVQVILLGEEPIKKTPRQLDSPTAYKTLARLMDADGEFWIDHDKDKWPKRKLRWLSGWIKNEFREFPQSPMEHPLQFANWAGRFLHEPMRYEDKAVRKIFYNLAGKEAYFLVR